jgi:SAM-dependent methyltransferase
VLVDALPQDPAARQDALEHWAELELRSKGSVRLRTKVAHRAARVTRRLDRFAGRVLDRGLDTSGDAYLPVHKTDGRVLYVPSAWHVLPRALRYIGVSERDTFVDFGCGKGRVLHQAARWPFQRVIGVEVSPELAEIARTALAARSRRHRCRNVEVVVSDVRQFRVPDDLTIAYFFRPFGDETLNAVLRGIAESIARNPRRVRMIYLSPMTSRSTILATGRFRLMQQQSSALRRHADLVAIFESC